MSRIVSGDSPDVKRVEPMAVGRTARDPKSAKFRMMRATDTMSLDEADARARELAQKAKVAALQEAEVKMKQPLQQALENLEGVLDEISRFRKELFKESEEEVLDLIQRVCRKVVGHELKTNPELLVQIVQRGLELLEKEKFIRVHLNPQDLQLFQKAKPDFDQKFAGRAEIELRVDPKISSGTAALSTETRELEVHIEHMVDEVLGAVRESIEEIKETGDEGDKI